MAGHGPIGGVLTALEVSKAEWALVAGCDMPGITREALLRLVAAIGGTDAECIIAVGPTGPEPLCAIYHRACLDAIGSAVAMGRLRMRDIVAELRTLAVAGMDPAGFANLNTPQDLEAFAQ